MLGKKEDTSGIRIILLWLCLVAIAGYASLPLLDAWSNDPSLKFGMYAFAIWQASVIFHWR